MKNASAGTLEAESDAVEGDDDPRAGEARAIESDRCPTGEAAREEGPSVAMSAPNRNGYAKVVGRILEIMDDVPRTFAGRPPTAFLSPTDEKLLRDGDERQLGADGYAAARDGSTADWRAFLADHFRLRYRFVLLFDAPKTVVQ
jgi:hypothetical protein